ncbi:MAG: AarF/UbiB family protein [Candidatus Obscuribacterales bacterium]|nr:AarF/UbiB family protein [Candidatus Obscuribacterales bacterium]
MTASDSSSKATNSDTAISNAPEEGSNPLLDEIISAQPIDDEKENLEATEHVSDLLLAARIDEDKNIAVTVTVAKAAKPAPPATSIDIIGIGTTSSANIATVCNLSATGAPLYDSKLADLAVMPSRIVNDKRFWRMAKTVINLSKVGAGNKWFPNREISEVDRKKLFAISFRETLVEFGPTFIKLGQFLSVRRDLLTPEMADELASLQDKVPPFDRDLVHKTILDELGREPEKIFAEFDYEPMGSASIGQVHKAKLQDGRDVVVKVQRPDLAQRFYQDLGYMRTFISWGRRLKPDGDWDGWMALSDEFGRTLFSEIDYLQEGKNADRMRTCLKEQTRIRIPRVIWKHTGRHVLTLEYAPGIKIDRKEELKAAGFDLETIGNELIYCYLEQVLIHGYFHADPHAGNLAIDEEGRIIIYDFGMVGEISEAQRMAIAGCVTSVIDKKSDNIATHLIELGVLKADANQVPIIRTLGPFIDYYSGKSIKDLDFTDLERDIDQIAFEKALRLPANLAYLLRAGSSLEGIARTLQPNFSFIEAGKPFIQRWLLSKPSALGPLLKVFFRYGQEAYKKGADKITNGARILGLGKVEPESSPGSAKGSQRGIARSPGRNLSSRTGKGGNGKQSTSFARTTGNGKSTPRAVNSNASVEKSNHSVSGSPSRTSPSNSSAALPALPTSPPLGVASSQVSIGGNADSQSTLPRNNFESTKEEVAKSKLSARTTIDSVSLDDVESLREQLYLLKTTVKRGAHRQLRLSVYSLVILFLSTLICVASFLPEYRSYATYFLIGNGVMGAIIMWHLVDAALLGKKFQEKR